MYDDEILMHVKNCTLRWI